MLNKFFANKKLIKFLLKLAGSLFFVWWIVFKVDWSEVWLYLQKISWWQVGLFTVFYLGGMLFSAYKWKFLAKHKNIRLSLLEFFELYFTATFINNFMPSFVGGDGFKIYRVGQLSGDYKGATSGVLLDRLTGLWGAMTLAIIFGGINLFNITRYDILVLTEILIVVSLLTGISLFFFLRKRSLEKIFGKSGRMIDVVIKEIDNYNKNGGKIWKAILLSFGFNFIGLAGANYILFWAMGIQIGLLNYLSVIFLISMVSSIPITINNIGIKEWAYISFFGLFGLEPSAVISVAILSRIIQMTLSFLALPIYLTEKKTH
ncbi:MAG TPA: flippase-like domain-containing protein [Candidatus Moranbacteria bacterium]|nr:flippase-like domain-containing protein [Candidatus Moranbacteria bacterium]